MLIYCMHALLFFGTLLIGLALWLKGKLSMHELPKEVMLRISENYPPNASGRFPGLDDSLDQGIDREINQGIGRRMDLEPHSESSPEEETSLKKHLKSTSPRTYQDE